MNLPSSFTAADWTRSALAIATTAALLAGCASTTPSLGGNKGVVSGAASGESAEGNNSKLESCPETLGTVAIEEDTAAPWYLQLHEHKLGSTIPVLRLMIQQSNCFVIVERGKSLHSMQRERDLARGDESRAGSNFGKGQMVAADYTMSPSIQFSGKTGGGNAFGGGYGGGILGMVAGSVSRNEASTTLLLIDNRSGVQIAAAEGTASNFDFGMLGSAFTGGAFGGGGGYANTPQGKVVVAAFADSYNQMVKALRNYKAQTVRGGLGTGGRLGVQGGDTPASKELDSRKKK
ncbi:CsgG/HfaB family protein [Aquabacterium sp.]|uniref:CsgG/HfaB family protein n=1 Tax=Aquabacterium sp. TaxID=1872578 RepID=UPI0035B09066